MRNKHIVKMDDYKFLGTNLKILTWIGLWPAALENQPILKKLHTLYGFYMIGTFFTFFTCSAIQIYFVWGDVLELMDNLSITLFYVVISAKCSVVLQRKKMRNLIEQTYDFQMNVLNDDNERNKTYFLRRANNNSNFNLWFICTIFLVFCFLISPSVLCLYQYNDPVYVSGEKPRVLPFNVWLPFDTQKYYRSAYLVLMILVTPGSFYVVVIDILLFSFIMSAICQVRVLQNSFTDLGQSKTKTVYQSAVDCVKMHQSLITYVDDLNDLISNTLFVDFLIYAMHLSSLGYTLLILGTDIELTQAMSCLNFLGGALLQLFIFYGMGNQLMLESVAVSDAIWNSDWYTYDAKVKKLLLLVITRSHIPLTLTVGKFYEMNLESLVIILRTWYSFLTLVKQMYG